MPTPVARGRRAGTAALWCARVVWALLPLSLGATVEDGLADVATSSRWVCAVGLWVGWATVLLGLAVRRPWGLTASRIAAPLPLMVAIIAALAGHTSWLALGHGALVVALVALPETGAELVDGLSYGDERRMLLRTPFGLYLGPIPAAWVMVVAGGSAGPLLLAAEQWVAGGICLILGWPAAWAGVRILHQLSRRWIVFVPNGFVVHDLLSTREPFLLRRQDVAGIGPAAAERSLDDDDLLDASQNALGLVLEVTLDGELEVVPRVRGVSQVRVVQHVLFSPTRPGALMVEARSRRIPR